MAFDVGSIVGLKVNNPGGAFPYTQTIQRQPPQFGVVADASADPDYEVLWPDGLLQGTIAETVIDEITEPDATEVARLQGRVVRITLAGATNSFSAIYDGQVVNLYRRRGSDDLAPGATLALIRTREGFYLEVLSSLLSVVAGQ